MAIAAQNGAWLEEFTNQPPAAPWVQALREAAFQRFVELGFPTTHDEEWRFTNVAPIARTSWLLQSRDREGAVRTEPSTCRSTVRERPFP